MSNTKCETLPWILYPIVAATLISFILPNIDRESMYIVSAISLAAHLHYGACVVSKIFLLMVSQGGHCIGKPSKTEKLNLFFDRGFVYLLVENPI